MAERYIEGANVNQLAAEFRCARQTVALRLKAHGVVMRNQPATPDEIAQVVELYASGLSLVDVAEKTRFSPKSVLNYLRAEGVPLRDTHGRERAPGNRLDR
jgi:DNA-binding NarL/FixJ family response regulator